MTATVSPTVIPIVAMVALLLLSVSMSRMFSTTTTPGKKLMVSACKGSSALRLRHLPTKKATAAPTTIFATAMMIRQSARWMTCCSSHFSIHDITYRILFSTNRHMVPLIRQAVNFCPGVPPNSMTVMNRKRIVRATALGVKKPKLYTTERVIVSMVITPDHTRGCFTLPLPR